jgi:hypothetical protein
MDAPQPVRKPKRMVGRRKQKPSGSLADEIEMLRQAIRQVWAKTDSDKDLDVWTKTLDNLGKACQRLATVLKAEAEMNVGEPIGDIVLRLAPEALEEIKRMDQEEARINQPALPGLLDQAPAPSAILAPTAGSAENAKAGELNGDAEQP